jgi:hypothetical protein
MPDPTTDTPAIPEKAVTDEWTPAHSAILDAAKSAVEPESLLAALDDFHGVGHGISPVLDPKVRSGVIDSVFNHMEAALPIALAARDEAADSAPKDWAAQIRRMAESYLGDTDLAITVGEQIAELIRPWLAARDNETAELRAENESLRAQVVKLLADQDEDLKEVARLHKWTEAKVAGVLDDLAIEMEAAQRQMRKEDERTIRSSGLGEGVRMVRARAASLRGGK